MSIAVSNSTPAFAISVIGREHWWLTRGCLCRQTQLAFPDLTKAQSAVQRVFAVLDRKSEIDPSAEGTAHSLDIQ